MQTRHKGQILLQDKIQKLLDSALAGDKQSLSVKELQAVMGDGGRKPVAAKGKQQRPSASSKSRDSGYSDDGGSKGRARSKSLPKAKGRKK